LDDYGFRSVIAPSFADIFYNNCFKNGVLPIVLADADIDELFKRGETAGYSLTVDLENQVVRDESGFERSFEVDPSRRENMLQGLDDIAQTLLVEEKISAYEAARTW
jgi:3-isopropylmalate/(R)-2-methylmalate dehydratase small subunit